MNGPKRRRASTCPEENGTEISFSTIHFADIPSERPHLPLSNDNDSFPSDGSIL
jgi:hypothetical protein